MVKCEINQIKCYYNFYILLLKRDGDNKMKKNDLKEIANKIWEILLKN